MESSELTDEELIELAKIRDPEDTGDCFDVKYYQDRFCISDGSYKIYFSHLYRHYKKWSISPISLDIFRDMLNLNKKTNIWCKINKEKCIINLDKLIGEYVKEEREKQKEKRFGKVPSFKPKTECQD